MAADIYLNIFFGIDAGAIQIETNAKPEAVEELLVDFLHSQVGAGKDDSAPNDLKLYRICLTVDLSDDSWYAKSNCGNKGLRDGILMYILKKIVDRPAEEWILEFKGERGGGLGPCVDCGIEDELNSDKKCPGCETAVPVFSAAPGVSTS